MTNERKNNSKIVNPHDKFIRETLGRKEIARDLIKEYLPSTIIKHINLKTLKISKDTHIDKELTDHFSDIIYTVELKGKKSFIYFLFEHKSYPDKLALFQVLRNMVKMWEDSIKQNRNIKKLPVIVPILLYHGKKAWQYSNNSDILFEIVEGTEKYVPTFSSELFDVSHIPDEDIKGKILTQIILLTLKYIFKPELSDKLDQIFDLFNDLSSKKKVTEYLEVLLRSQHLLYKCLYRQRNKIEFCFL
jgi:predicted transposase/invertase (TIGR01784 family)